MKNKLIYWIIAILITFTIILFSLNWLIQDEHFYKKQYEKLDSYSRTNNTINETKILINYLTNFNNNNNYKNNNLIQSNVYTNNEKLHLKDVKNLIILSKYLILLNLLLISFSIYFLKLNLKTLTKYNLILLIIISLIIILFLQFNFQNSFKIFHEILFTGNYSFPYYSYLIRLFPSTFFKNSGISIFLRSFFISIIFYLFFLTRKCLFYQKKIIKTGKNPLFKSKI